MELLAFISIDALREWVQNSGYAGGVGIVFLMLFLCGVGLPVPEDIPLIVSGAFLCNSPERWVITGVACWTGIIGGDIMLYWLGRRYGMGVTKMPIIGKHISIHRVDWVKQKFNEYGVMVVAVGRLFAGIRGVMVFTAGTLKYNFWKFLIADGLAAVLSGGMFMVVGHYLGKNLTDENISKYKHWFALGAGVLVVVVVAYIAYKIKFHKPPVTVAAIDKAVEKEQQSAES